MLLCAGSHVTCNTWVDTIHAELEIWSPSNGTVNQIKVTCALIKVCGLLYCYSQFFVSMVLRENSIAQ